MNTYRPLQAKSEKAREREARWSKVRAEVLKRDNYTCKAAIEGVCIKRATDAHHLLKKSLGGKDEPDNLLSVCRRCHEWIEANPEEAWERGLYISPKQEARRG